MIKNFEKKPQAFVDKVKETAAGGSKMTALAKIARDEQEPVSAYAAVYLAVQEGLGVTPFDSQVIAGAYLDDENVVELATGEGKTIAAVFAAFMSVCRGECVHIMTFNDYLAKRDREWMKPVYDLLGVSTACITESSTREERRAAYRADVLYITVRECGFDFLRDFLVFSPEETVGNGYERAIVDEADSLLIDEARIPMVAAGIMDIEENTRLPEVFEFAKTLNAEDYGTDEEAGTAFLTRRGEKKAEERFGLENIYQRKNMELLTMLNDCLKAIHILKENIDYIVKDGQIKIIDPFTGRAAANRRFSDSFQSAVELKHGLARTESSVIMGSIPIQFFLRQYKRVSGMTGTAVTAKDEFSELYGLVVKRVEPNTPSVRKDLPLAVYYDEKSKLAAVVRETKAAHEKKQPVLIGTADIAQSERLSKLLKATGIEHSVLNAKNDELEAGIISSAGAPGAVTVSTNMAGRGVDIKLGGADEKLRDEAVKAGGLYAIGTFLAESARINDQLRGRAARQGDPGQSRLFISLDEEIMRVYKLKRQIPAGRYPSPTEAEITDKTVVREAARIQVISQGKRLDERERLLKFTMIGEKHRDITFDLRKKYLTGEREPDIWQKEFPEEYKQAVERFGEDTMKKLQRECILAELNIQWCIYLEIAAQVREGIHLSAIGGKDPAEEYNIAIEDYFEDMGKELIGSLGKALDEILEKTPDAYKPRKPKSISTYLLEDTGDELERRTLAQALNGDYAGDDDENEDEDEESEALSGTADEETESDVPEGAVNAITDNTKEKDKTEKKGFFSKLFGKK